MTGGNVSLYNENPTGAIYPTPVIGMVGLVESLSHVTTSHFAEDGDAIILLGEPTDEIGGSEYLARIHGLVAGAPPACDLDRERALIDAVLAAIATGAVRSAHDCSEGGLSVALAECCTMRRDQMVGATVDLSAWTGLPLRALLFGEAQGRVVMSSPDPAAVLQVAASHGVPAREIGRVSASSGALEIVVGARHIVAPLGRLAAAYHDAIPAQMSRPASVAAVAAAGLESAVS